MKVQLETNFRKCVSFLFFSLIIVVTYNASAEISCPSAHRLSDEAFSKLLSEYSSPVAENPIVMVGHRKSPLGAIQYELKRVGTSWVSTYKDFPNAPQGDPRIAFSQFGKNVAEYLGFQMISSKSMLVPSADHINAALDSINQTLPKDLHFTARFYDTDPDDPRIGPAEYLRQIGMENRYPLATRGSILIHDLSYHLPTIVYPKIVLAQVRQTVQLFLKFWEMAEPKLKKEYGQKGVNALHVIAKNISDEIDGHMGNFGITLRANEEPKHDRFGVSTSYTPHIYFLVGRDPSAMTKLEQFVDTAFGSYPYTKDNFISEMLGTKKRNQIERRTLSLFRKFLESPEIKDSQFAVPFSYSHEEIVHGVQRDLSLLESAVKKLNATGTK